MNAALLNSSRTMNAGPETQGDILGQIEEVAGGYVVNAGSTPSEGLSAERIKTYAESGQKLLEAGKNPKMQIDPQGLLGAVSAGALAGAGIAGVGAVAGAIAAGVIYVVAGLFGGSGPSYWDNAGENVHWWFTNYAPQEFLTWLQSNGVEGVTASVQESARGLLSYWLLNDGYVLMPGQSYYNGRADYDFARNAISGQPGFAGSTAEVEQWLSDYYANFGVDYRGTVASWQQNGRGPLLMFKRLFVSDSEVSDAASRVDAADAATDAQGSKLAAVAAAALSLASLLK